MTEAEYISATDLVKVRQALRLIAEMSTEHEGVHLAYKALAPVSSLLEKQVAIAMGNDGEE